MSNRHAVVASIVAIVVALVGCSPALPDSVIAGSRVTVGWSGTFTSANAVAVPTAGNLDVAAATRADFGEVSNGVRVPDDSFGTIAVISEAPFTVRFDLAEPRWSDGIPLDAADLMLGWAGIAGYFAPDQLTSTSGVPPAGDEVAEPLVPVVDEFARAIEVTFSPGDLDWEQAVSAPVPAHVLGMRAFGMDDPMAAKKAVIEAIHSADADALTAMATVWNEGFSLPESGQIPADLLLSSGPYRVQSIEQSGAGQSVTLVPNTDFTGVSTAVTAEVVLVPPGQDPLTIAGSELDVVQVAPAVTNYAQVKELERQDFLVNVTHDGTMWALFVRPTGIFTRQQVRVALMRAVDTRAMIDIGAGEWASAYTSTTSMLAAPNLPSYPIVSEDSGFMSSLGTPAEDGTRDREIAGVKPTDRVCVLYDRASEFASGAFEGLRSVAAESGWAITDCGSDDFAGALENDNWNAVIANVRIPDSPQQIRDQWGTSGATSIIDESDPNRDQLITRYEQTTDVYESREVLAEIEATIVRSAVALPIAVNPRLTVISRTVEGVASSNGAGSIIMRGITRWVRTE